MLFLSCRLTFSSMHAYMKELHHAQSDLEPGIEWKRQQKGIMEKRWAITFVLAI